MGVERICPVCHTHYTDGKEFCATCMAPTVPFVEEAEETLGEAQGSPDGGCIDTPASLDTSEAPRVANNQDASLTPAAQARPTCGYPSLFDGTCPACGAEVAAAGSSKLRLTLSDGTQAEVDAGGAGIIIGRESPIACVARLCETDKTISREHCRLSVIGSERRISVSDVRSTNGTFIFAGGDFIRIQQGETATVELPARIRLGRRTIVNIERGDAS